MNYKKGFTLIEVLVTSIILAFVLSGAAMFLILSSRFSEEGINEAFLQSNLNLTLKRISTDVKNGYSVGVPNEKTIEIKDRSGNTINTWVFDSDNKTLSKNSNTIDPIGINIEYDCKFTKSADFAVTIEMKMTGSKNGRLPATFGNDYLKFVYTCRNVINANI